jgi:hypothetical protein
LLLAKIGEIRGSIGAAVPSAFSLQPAFSHHEDHEEHEEHEEKI